MAPNSDGLGRSPQRENVVRRAFPTHAARQPNTAAPRAEKLVLGSAPLASHRLRNGGYVRSLASSGAAGVMVALLVACWLRLPRCTASAESERGNHVAEIDSAIAFAHSDDKPGGEASDSEQFRSVPRTG